MITPMEIQTKKFEKAVMGGYNKQDVDDYMEYILEDYEVLYKQSISAEKEIKALREQIESFKSMEETMKNSIMVAQQAAEKLETAANEKAEIIIKEAEAKAKEIMENANKSIEQSVKDLAQMQRTMDVYKCQAISMLNAQIESLQKFETMPK